MKKSALVVSFLVLCLTVLSQSPEFINYQGVLRDANGNILSSTTIKTSSKIEIDGEKIRVTREIDGGLQTINLNMPAIITTDLRLNEPRYASLPNIMKAKKKPIDQKSPSDYGVDTAPRVKVLKVIEPPKRQAGIKVENIGELVEKLKNEAGVLWHHYFILNIQMAK